ncbi:ATP-binding protein, partial [Streptococcus pneumoniae]|nr:ATP-binding protein [Streptococcus pneumoniae]
VDKSRSRKLGGSGLGLAIAKELVESHGGHINIDSAPKSGTTVTITLKRGDGHA